MSYIPYSFPQLSNAFGPRLFRTLLKNIREYICKNRKISLAGASAHGLVATISASIADMLGLPLILATGATAALLHFVLTVLKGTFCDMTDEQVLQAINDNDTKSKKASSPAKKKAASKKKR